MSRMRAGGDRWRTRKRGRREKRKERKRRKGR